TIYDLCTVIRIIVISLFIISITILHSCLENVFQNHFQQQLVKNKWYFQPVHPDIIVNRTELFVGMLIIPVGSGSAQPGVPVVEGSRPEFLLQDSLNLVLASPKPFGIYLRIQSQSQLEPSLHLLSSAYHSDLLYRPVWVNMALSHGAFQTQGYISGMEFLHTVNQVFPYVTLAPSWPLEVLREGYNRAMVDDMEVLLKEAWQAVSLQVRAEPLGRSVEGQRRIREVQSRYSLTVETGIESGIDEEAGPQAIMANLSGSKDRSLYDILILCVTWLKHLNASS
uniref:Protein FAM151A n=1 Tax=Oncorhynchus tshawytscha TaxID=74940 RepID=A0AAZ3R4U4_ONCTS